MRTLLQVKITLSTSCTIYLIFFFIKSRLTKNYSINKTFKNIKIINFNSKLINKWEHLPPHIIDEIKNKKINIIIKFGMNLLKIDDNLKDVKILSFSSR